MDLNIGRMPHGPRNSIADVSGVRVGHCTVDDERHKTGVTVILPCEDDISAIKYPRLTTFSTASEKPPG